MVQLSLSVRVCICGRTAHRVVSVCPIVELLLKHVCSVSFNLARLAVAQSALEFVVHPVYVKLLYVMRAIDPMRCDCSPSTHNM